MVDIVDKKTRSRMMSSIRGKNTKPELIVRSELHKAGFRFRLHQKNLPGKPDIVLKKYNAVILVNGCFWHGHDCHLFKLKPTANNYDFWHQKITTNKQNDVKNRQLLEGMGWRILLIWECALKGKNRIGTRELIAEIDGWLRSGHCHHEIFGEQKNGLA